MKMILLKENEELKKQLEELKEMHKDMARYALDNEAKIDELNSQQKEFVNFLEDEIKEDKDNLEKLCELYKISKENNSAYSFAYSYINKMEAILQKYKEIIGAVDE